MFEKPLLLIILIATFYFFVPYGAAQEDEIAAPSQNEKSTLIIYRPRFSPPLAYKPMMTINGKKAFYLPRGYHAELKFDAGKYDILADWKVMHGVPDREVSLTLNPGETRYLAVSTSLNAMPGGTNISADVKSVDAPDLTKSTKVSRWHAQWLVSSVGGNVPEETLEARYELSINSEALIEDFQNGSDEDKTKIVKFLFGHRIFEEEIALAFEKEALRRYKESFETKVAVQPVAYVLKYVAASRMKEFLPTVKEVQANATDKRLRKYAKRYLESYYGIEIKTK